MIAIEALYIISFLIIGITFLLISIKKIKFTYWLSIGCVFLPINYINRYFYNLPSFSKWIPIFLIMLCFVAVLLHHLFRAKIVIPRSIKIFVLILLFFSFLSYLANANATVFSALFSGMGLLSFLLFLVIVNNKDYHLDNFKLYKLLISFGIISAIVAFFQRVLLVSILHIGSGDMVTGLMSLDGYYTFYQLFCFIIIFIFWLYNKEIFKSISNFRLALLFLASIAVTDDRAALLFLPFIFLVVFFHVQKRLLLKKFRTVIAVFFILLLSIIVLDSFSKSKQGHEQGFISELLQPGYLQDNLFGSEYSASAEFDKGGVLRRGSALTFNYALISKSTSDLIFGKGPGTTSETNLPGAEGDLNKRYATLNIGRSSYSQLIAELGFGGIFLLLIFLITTYFFKTSAYELKEFIIIRKTTVILLLPYFAYENLFKSWAFSLILSSLFILPINTTKVTVTDNGAL